MGENKKINELFEFLPKSKRNAKYGQVTGDYPFFASSNIVTKYVNEPDYTKNKLILGDGGTASINYADKDFSCSDHCYILKPKDDKLLNCKYVYWFLYSNIHILEEGFKGVGIKNISKSYIQNIEMSVPNKEEQDNVVAVLDKVDEIRQKKILSNEKLDEFLKSTFKDMFGTPIVNEKQWQVKNLKELSSGIMSGNTPKGGSQVYVTSGIEFYRSQNVWNNKIVKDDIAYIDEETHNKMKRSSLKHNDILITKTGRINTENSSLGRSALYEGDDDKANINGHVYFVRLKEGINHKFVLTILTSKEYREHIRRVCVGGIDKRQLNKEHIEDFPIICPPIELQNKFAQIVEKVEEQKQKNEKVIEQMDNLFNSLSQKVFKGPSYR